MKPYLEKLQTIIKLQEFTIETIFLKHYLKIIKKNNEDIPNKEICYFDKKIFYKEFDNIKERDLYYSTNIDKIYNINNKDYHLTKNYLYLKDISENNDFVYSLDVSNYFYNLEIMKVYKKLNKCVFFNLT